MCYHPISKGILQYPACAGGAVVMYEGSSVLVDVAVEKAAA